MSDPNDKLFLGKLGKPFGLKGLLKARIESDFPEFFAIGRVLTARRLDEEFPLTIDRFDYDRGLIGFVGYDAPETAASLTNCELLAAIDETKAAIRLKEGERFMFELVGMEVFENSALVAKVVEISDSTPPLLTLQSSDSKRLLIPFIDRYILRIEDDKILTQNIQELFEAI